jgi:hypothetical protein
MFTKVGTSLAKVLGKKSGRILKSPSTDLVSALSAALCNIWVMAKVTAICG